MGSPKTNTPSPVNKPDQPVEQALALVKPLSWETSVPARKAWSEELFKMVAAQYDILSQASDVLRIHPLFNRLNKSQQITCLCQFIATMTYYESGYNPKASSVDVGEVNVLDTYSVGLLQLSVVDQKNLNIPLGYTYADLQDPIKNLNLGVRIMANQVRKRGKFLIAKGESGNPGVYWAVIHPGGKYDKTSEILANVHKWTFEVAVKPSEVPPTVSSKEAEMRAELVSNMAKYVGERESNGYNRSPVIDAANRGLGVALGSSYCMSGFYWYGIKPFIEARGWKAPTWMKTASTQNFWNNCPVKYKTLKGAGLGKKGDAGLMRNYDDAGKGHVYILADNETNKGVPTIEFNTNPAGSRDGDGVHARTRTQAGDSSKKYLGSINVLQALLDHNNRG